MPKKKTQSLKVLETKNKQNSKTKATTKKSVTKKKSTTKSKQQSIKWRDIPLEELHPFDGFPYRLEYQDGNDRRTCHFECEQHRTKHIVRYNLKSKDIRLNYKYDD